MKAKYLGLALLATSNFSVFANNDEETPFSASVFAGIATGGEKLANIEYDNDTSDSIKAGGGLVIGAGLNYSLDENWSIQSNMGYFFDTDNAENADIGITRFTLDVNPYYQINDDFKVGAGITYHINPEFEYDYTNIFKTTTEFDNALGFYVTLGYELQSLNSWIELRYNAIDYTVSNIKLSSVNMDITDTPTIDANSLMLNYFYSF
jgi:hypothetical protein